MRSAIRLITLSLVASLLGLGTATPATAAVWESCGTWANWSEGGYNLYNNIWGSGAGTQCIWANSHSNWGVTADHPATPGVKSYPNSERPNIRTRISGLKTLTSTFDVTVPSGGAYATAYDIWAGRSYEIMLWVNKQGSVAPWADRYDDFGNPIPRVSAVSLGGHTWDAFYNGGPRGRHVVSLVRTANANAGTVDILACLQWIRNQGWIGDISIEKVQLGFEISGSPGGMSFTMNDYGVTFSR
ncbi:GH12 family glycosyl hydrolase domain-containing protein [Allorhizocola rhizosphaerae]|uniref:GH12 family glycosyl hydrolase domain-containing protein n=1 Tax=Allorhizocola rhizosphaerae TaxID=1872709 RepID=UPI000E3EB08F|nr:hypothetical protein [Allorhizocola rhizosphaerae]